MKGVNVGHVQKLEFGKFPDTPRTESAARAALKLRTWVGRQLLMSTRMVELERELNALRDAVQRRHPEHDDPECELCAVLYPVGGYDE